MLDEFCGDGVDEGAAAVDEDEVVVLDVGEGFRDEVVGALDCGGIEPG